VVSEGAGFRKPDCRIFQSALDVLALEAAECAFVGDHPVNDIVGSREAGLTAVWLAGMHPWPADVLKSEHSIIRLAEIHSILETPEGGRATI